MRLRRLVASPSVALAPMRRELGSSGGAWCWWRAGCPRGGVARRVSRPRFPFPVRVAVGFRPCGTDYSLCFNGKVRGSRRGTNGPGTVRNLTSHAMRMRHASPSPHRTPAAARHASVRSVYRLEDSRTREVFPLVTTLRNERKEYANRYKLWSILCNVTNLAFKVHGCAGERRVAYAHGASPARSHTHSTIPGPTPSGSSRDPSSKQRR